MDVFREHDSIESNISADIKNIFVTNKVLLAVAHQIGILQPVDNYSFEYVASTVN